AEAVRKNMDPTLARQKSIVSRQGRTAANICSAEMDHTAVTGEDIAARVVGCKRACKSITRADSAWHSQDEIWRCQNRVGRPDKVAIDRTQENTDGTTCVV